MGTDLVDRRDRKTGLPRVLSWTGAVVVLGVFPVAVLVRLHTGFARFLSDLCGRSGIDFRWVALVVALLLFAYVDGRTLPRATRFVQGHPRMGLWLLFLSLLALVLLALLALPIALGLLTAWHSV